MMRKDMMNPEFKGQKATYTAFFLGRLPRSMTLKTDGPDALA